MTMMRAGDLRRRLVIQRRLQTQDTFGQQFLRWTDYIAGLALANPKTITAATAGTATSFACAAHGFSVGQLVTIGGITGLDFLPATFGVLSATADAFQVDFDSTGMTLAVSSASATLVSGVPADIQPLSARDLLTGGGGYGEITHKLVLRYHPLLVDPIPVGAMRAIHVHGAVTRRFNLTPALNVDSRNRQITVMASEGLTPG